MPSVQIKNVPEDVQAELHRRANAAGQSLQEYLLNRLVAEARAASIDDVLARAGSHRGGSAPIDVVTQILRQERDSR